MRFRIKAGGPAARFTFDRTPKPQPPSSRQITSISTSISSRHAKNGQWVRSDKIRARLSAGAMPRSASWYSETPIPSRMVPAAEKTSCHPKPWGQGRKDSPHTHRSTR